MAWLGGRELGHRTGECVENAQTHVKSENIRKTKKPPRNACGVQPI
jgi:hypothetical protein